MNYVEKKYVVKDTVEAREYQISMAEDSVQENCVIVLPTGLGKTAIALLVIAEYMARGTGAVLFLAPTRVLANQHYEFLRNSMTIQDISLVTGEDTASNRKKRWMSSIICATPEIARNDIHRGIVRPAQFALVVFDEVHRTVGDYAYATIADWFAGSSARMLGMTATLPSEMQKATEILTRLRISRVVERTDQSPDVVPYVQDTNTQWVKVDLPPEMIQMQKSLKKVLADRYDILKSQGFRDLGSVSLSALLRIRPIVLSKYRHLSPALFAAIRTHHALNMLEAHGITAFLRFCERTRKKGGPGVKALFDDDPRFSRTIRAAQEAQARGMEHSKIPKLLEILSDIPGKILIFTSYRDSVEVINDKLKASGISSAVLIGKSGETGLKQKRQIETVQKFRSGEYRVLIATRVGEEGLDIAEVNHVIFYDNVPSSIRYIQRRGRTGRKNEGKLIVLMAKNTIDETYYWVSKRKVRAAGRMGERINQVLEDSKNHPVQTGMDAFLG